MHGHFKSFIMGFIETQSSDPLDLTYKSNFQILYSVTFSWLEQQHYQKDFTDLRDFQFFIKTKDILGGSQPIDLLKSPPEKRHELTSSMSLQVLTSLLSLSDFAVLVTTHYR